MSPAGETGAAALSKATPAYAATRVFDMTLPLAP